MMGGVSPETCWAIKKHWNNKFYYTVASSWFFLWILVQYTFTHKQYTERHKTNNIYRTTQKFWMSGGRAPSLRVIPWHLHLPYNWGKNTVKLQSG